MKIHVLRMIAACAAAIAAAIAQTPVVDCVVHNQNTGMYTAYYGYTAGASPATIPLGASNYVDAGAVLRGSVPASFAGYPSLHMLFSLTFASTVTPAWHLNGLKAMAGASQASSCQVPVGTQLPGDSLARCWDRNGNQACDVSEDLDGDGFCTILDCAGPEGKTGPAGRQGPAGDIGPSGPPGKVPLFQTVTISSDHPNATATCAANQFLVTGGGICAESKRDGNNGSEGRTASSAPSGNGWAVSCNDGQATAVAVCASKQ